MLENLKIAVGCEANYHQIRFNLQSFVVLLPIPKKKKKFEDKKLKNNNKNVI